MSYELSFTEDFFFEEGDDHFGGETERPTSVWAAVKALAKFQPDGWASMCAEVFPNVLADRVDISMVVDKIRATNSCSDLRSPVRVWIDEGGWHQVIVYDKKES